MIVAKLEESKKVLPLVDAYDEKGKGAKHSQHIFAFRLVALTALWWIFSSLFSVASKKALRASADAHPGFMGSASAALLITCLQLCGAAILSLVICALRGELDSVWALCRRSLAVGILHAAGNLATNLLVVLSSVGSALAFKAAEPLFVALALWFLSRDNFHKSIPGHALVFLAMVGVGAGVAAYKPPLLPSIIFSASMCNAAFATRTVLAKQLRNTSSNENAALPNPSMSLIFYSCCVVGAAATLAMVSTAAFIFDFGPVLTLSLTNTTGASAGAYFMYNYMSFLALDMVTSPVHSLLKVGKGLSVLLAAAVFLGEDFAPIRWAGLFVATLGMVLYQMAVAADGNLLAGRFVRPALSRMVRISAIFCVFFLTNGLLTKTTAQGDHRHFLMENAAHKAVQAAMPMVPSIFSREVKPFPRPSSIDRSASSSSSVPQSNTSPHLEGLDDADHRDRRDPGRWLQCLQDIGAQHDKIFSPWLNDPWLRDSKLLFLDPAEHSNLGDVALAYGAHRLFSRFGYFRQSITRCRLMQSKSGTPCSPEVYSRHRLAFFHAGGNWGDLYRGVHTVRLKAIEEMAAFDITFISLPQSYVYRNRAWAKNDASHLSDAIFAVPGMTAAKAKKRFTLTWREQKSFNDASEAMPFVSHLLVPDIAFSTGPFFQQVEHHRSEKVVDILFIWRNDNEGRFKAQRDDKMVRSWLDEFPGGRKITFALEDWSIVSRGQALKFAGRVPGGFNDGTYEAIHAGVTTFLSGGRVVITDRLHGSILSLLNFANHIYVDNAYNKSSNVRDVALTSEACRDKDALGYKKAYSMKEAVRIAVEWLPNLKSAAVE